MVKYSRVDRLYLRGKNTLGVSLWTKSWISMETIAVCNEGANVLHLVMPVSLFVFSNDMSLLWMDLFYRTVSWQWCICSYIVYIYTTLVCVLEIIFVLLLQLYSEKIQYQCRPVQIIGDMETTGGDDSDNTAEKMPQQRWWTITTPPDQTQVRR